MARESNWYAAVFAVLAGVFLGATLARQRGREIPDGSPPVLVDGPAPGMDADSEDAVPAAIEPLSAKLLKTRVVDIFPVGYLTLMAIIQGAAFAALFITIQQDGLFAHGWTLYAWLALSQSLATGLTLIGVCIMILGTRNQNELYDEYRVPRWRWTH